MEETRFTDEQGNVLGYLVTDASFDRIASFLLPPPTKEELAEARQEMLERGGVSIGEILAAIEEQIGNGEAAQQAIALSSAAGSLRDRDQAPMQTRRRMRAMLRASSSPR